MEGKVDLEVAGLIIGFIFVCVIVFLIVLVFGKSEEESCDNVGGEYKVVGQEYDPALKQTIDMYGCVKIKE